MWTYVYIYIYAYIHIYAYTHIDSTHIISYYLESLIESGYEFELQGQILVLPA